MLADDDAWTAVLQRDRAFDGRFVTGVLTTGIYCRPSCAARHPARGNVRFFADGAAARAAGLRPCKRCLPDDVSRDERAVLAAIAAIKAAEQPLALAALAAETGYSPSHFQRVFTRHTGLSPAAYARALMAERAAQALSGEERVTDAIYAAGYSAPSRFYEANRGRLGMAPSAWVGGGKGVTIHWAVVPTSLGSMLVAAVEAPGDFSHIPLDVKGTAFQEAVWRELQKIPAGETRTYAQLAAAVGKPRAVRAAGSANGANNVAVLIPCHRVVRSDGSLGGYAYGLPIKRELLKREEM